MKRQIINTNNSYLYDIRDGSFLEKIRPYLNNVSQNDRGLELFDLDNLNKNDRFHQIFVCGDYLGSPQGLVGINTYHKVSEFLNKSITFADRKISERNFVVNVAQNYQLGDAISEVIIESLSVKNEDLDIKVFAMIKELPSEFIIIPSNHCSKPSLCPSIAIMNKYTTVRLDALEGFEKNESRKVYIWKNNE